MSTTTSTIAGSFATGYELSRDDLQEIELEAIVYPSSALTKTQSHRRASLHVPASEIHESDRPLTSPEQLPNLSKWQTTVIIGTVACVTFLNSMLGGILTVSLPSMALDVHLADELLLWPASVNALACGCTLLVAGSVADVVGGRKIYLIGTFALMIATVACGAAKTGIQLILFRAAQGVAISLCIPSSVILITQNIPTGSGRNIAFACLGAGQPVGFSIGLVLGGIFVDGIGWRWGYYIGAIVTLVIFIVSIFGVPSDPIAESQSWSTINKRLRSDIDWIGCLLLSTSMGLFSYVLSVLAGGLSNFVAPASITLFSIAVLLVPIFAFYSLRQERLGSNIIIPPSLWKNRVFTCLCIAVFITWGIFNAVQFFLTLFFQKVQALSAIETSLRFLPMVVTGTSFNIATGWLVKHIRADILVLVAASITTVSPLLLALIDPSWSYWSCAFFAVACTPCCADTLFTVANLVITTIFPPQTHGLAGGVFNTISNIGNSVGLAITAVVASSVTLARHHNVKGEEDAMGLMEGYRATFWFCLAADVVVLGVVGLGLRRIGKVGVKID